MLPNSLIAKNRLFLERDSKHRRITTRVGNTFRNSKWSNYTLKNTNVNDNYTFIHLALFSFKVIFIVIFTWNIAYFLNELYVTNIIFDYFFNHFDTTLNFSGQTKFILPLIWHFLVKLVLEESLYKLLSGKSTNLFNQPFSSINNSYSSSFKQPLEQINAQNLINHSKLATNSNLSMGETKLFILPSLFLYRILNNNFSYSRPNLIQDGVFSSVSLMLSQSEHSLNSVKTLELKKFTTNSNKWLLTNHKTDLNGLFYINNFNYQLLNNLLSNPLLQTISTNVTNYNNIVKTLRWSYRYNILHRKVLTNSNKLTTSKHLLGSGFFDSQMTNSNIWLSDNLSRFTNFQTLSNSLSNYWLGLYKSNLGRINPTFINNSYLSSTSNTFNLLSFYETSFIFFIKRFYYFMGLQSNTFSSTLNLSNDVRTDTNLRTTSNKFSFLAEGLVRSQVITNPTLNPFYNHTTFKNTFDTASDKFISKDTVSVSNELDLLSGDYLDLISNLTTSLTLRNNFISFFSTNVYESSNTFNTELQFLHNNLPSNFSKPQLNSTQIETDFLKDLYLASLIFLKK